MAEPDLNLGPCDSESVLPRFAISSRSGFMQKGLRLRASSGHKGRLQDLVTRTGPNAQRKTTIPGKDKYSRAQREDFMRPGGWDIQGQGEKETQKRNKYFCLLH